MSLFKPRVLCLYTGRRSAAYPRPGYQVELVEFIESMHVSVVIVRSRTDPNEMESMVAELPEFVEIWANDAFSIFRRAGT